MIRERQRQQKIGSFPQPGRLAPAPMGRRHPDVILDDPAVLPAPAAEPDPGPLQAAVVARGRVVHAPTGERVFCGYDVKGKEVFRAKFKVHQPGETVMLPVAEVARLRQLGFLMGS